MAMFHFRLKSDKKLNGTKISAVQHVKYINREEKFSSQAQWQEKNKFVGDFITTAEIKNLLEGQNTLLYKTDDFGSIRNSANGIEVSQNASETTIAIALLLSHEAMNNQPLILHGSPLFQKLYSMPRFKMICTSLSPINSHKMNFYASRPAMKSQEVEAGT